jgi:anti-sigma regulatory factor (Ser/Thr protein kinase)
MALMDGLRLPVDESSRVGEARRLAAHYCRSIGFAETDVARVGIIVTEMATNILNHAGCGEIVVAPLDCGGLPAMDLLSIDRGPGMADAARGLRDGYTTTGTRGTGLGAIARMSSQFDIFSEPGKGTVVLSRNWAGRAPSRPPAGRMDVGAICLSMTDGDPCGDGWAAEHGEPRSIILVCDGLGHGPDAAEATAEAVRLFRVHRMKQVGEIVEMLHAGLRGTRGAALSVLEVDRANSTVRYCGVGNIAARLIAGDAERNLISHNGTAGQGAPRIQEFAYPWGGFGLLVIHSDGIASHWQLADHPGLSARHPAVIAAVLYRDHRRGRDDQTVVVARRPRTNQLTGLQHGPPDPQG